VEFRVLGPLEICRDGAALDLGGYRQEVVLSMLLLDAPRPVSVDRLVDAVWPASPPATARSQIQICVSNVRRILGGRQAASTVTTHRTGYALELGPADFDLRSFQGAVDRARAQVGAGRPDDAARILRDALDLWRGVPFSGLDSPPLADAALRLDRMRIDLLEEYADLALARGQAAELVSLLADEVDRNPLREHLRCGLMLALYRAGRQAEALAEFRRARRISMAELGVEPGEELRRLESAILRQDPGLDEQAAPDRHPPPDRAEAGGAPRLLPADVADFTGRQATIAAIRHHLVRVRETPAPGGTAVSVLTGQGGIGKTALAVRVAHEVADHYPDGQLFASMHGTTQPVRAEQVLERFLRALGVASAAIPESLDARSEWYRNLLVDRQILVVLDDVASEGQVAPLMPAGPGCAVILTSRRRLTGLPGARRIELSTFSPASAMALLGRVIGQERVDRSPETAAALVQLCGYLPLAVRIGAARLAANPHRSMGGMVERLSRETPLDELRHGEVAVRASLQLTYEALSPPARRLLRLVSLVEGPDVTAWACAAVLDVDLATVQDLLDELVELHVFDVEVDGDVDTASDAGAARYRLHDLVRLFARERAVAEEEAPERAAAITRYLGAMLALGEAAHRREYGGDFLVVHGDAPRYALDPVVVDALLVHPLDWLARERSTLLAAISQAAEAGLTTLSWDLAVSAVVLYETHALFDDWRESHAVALAATRRAGDRLGEAMMLYSLGSLHMFEQRFTEAGRFFDDAFGLFAAAGSAQGCAMVHRNRAFIDRVEGRYGRARERNADALRVFRRTGDRAGVAHVLGSLAQIDLDLGDEGLALDRLQEAAAICSEIGNRRVGAQVAHRLGELRLRRGETAAAATAFAEVRDVARASRDRTGEAYALVGLAEVAVRRGDLPLARHTVVQAIRLADEVREDRVLARSLLLAAYLDLVEGDLAAARGSAERALRISTELGIPLVRVSSLALLGDILEADDRSEDAVATWSRAMDQLRAILPELNGELSTGLRQRLDLLVPDTTGGPDAPNHR